VAFKVESHFFYGIKLQHQSNFSASDIYSSLFFIFNLLYLRHQKLI